MGCVMGDREMHRVLDAKEGGGTLGSYVTLHITL